MNSIKTAFSFKTVFSPSYVNGSVAFSKSTLALKLITALCLVAIGGCVGDGYDKATPITKSRSDLQAEIYIDANRSNASHDSGYSRLYALDTTLYATVKGEGVQVIDNSNPVSPKGLAFINLPGIEDVVIEGDSFVTNQYSDLVIFSISQQKELSRVKDLYNYQDYIELPRGAVWSVEGSLLKDQVVVGYELEEKDNETCFIFCW